MVRELLLRDDQEVIVFDNMASGDLAHLEGLQDDPRLEVIEADLQDLNRVVGAMDGVDHVYLFAANPTSLRP